MSDGPQWQQTKNVSDRQLRRRNHHRKLGHSRHPRQQNRTHRRRRPGGKIDFQNLWSPTKRVPGAEKLSLAFKNPNVHSRAFLNYRNDNGNIDAVVDVTAAHEGFLVGGEAGYDLQKAAVTRYAIALAYQTPNYVASVTGIQNLSVLRRFILPESQPLHRSRYQDRI